MGSCLKSDPPQWKNSEGTPFTNSIKCKVVRGTLVHLNSFVIAIFLVTDLRFGDVAAQLDILNTMGLIGPGGSRGQVSAALPKASES